MNAISRSFIKFVDTFFRSTWDRNEEGDEQGRHKTMKTQLKGCESIDVI
jgi:hypothetical protein